MKPEKAKLVVDGLKEADRKSTRLNSSHMSISYAVFCLKKKKEKSRCALATPRELHLLVETITALLPRVDQPRGLALPLTPEQLHTVRHNPRVRLASIS